jgi:hypothetical protein
VVSVPECTLSVLPPCGAGSMSSIEQDGTRNLGTLDVVKKPAGIRLLAGHAVDPVPERRHPRPLFADFVRARGAVRPGDPHVLPLVRVRMPPRIVTISVWRRLGRRLWRPLGD